MSELDKDFEKTVEQVNAKLAEAAKALREANKLAEKIGFHHGLINSQWAREAEGTDLDEEDFETEEEYEDACDRAYDEQEEKYDAIDVSDLESAMEEAGWSTSSSYC